MKINYNDVFPEPMSCIVYISDLCTSIVFRYPLFAKITKHRDSFNKIMHQFVLYKDTDVCRYTHSAGNLSNPAPTYWQEKLGFILNI